MAENAYYFGEQENDEMTLEGFKTTPLCLTV